MVYNVKLGRISAHEMHENYQVLNVLAIFFFSFFPDLFSSSLILNYGKKETKVSASTGNRKMITITGPLLWLHPHEMVFKKLVTH